MRPMIHALPSRTRLLLSVLLPLLGLVGGIAPGAMAADTLQVTIGSPTPEQGVPFPVEFSGQTTAVNGEGDGPQLVAVVRPAGGIGCQADLADDKAAAGGVSTEIFGPELDVWVDEPQEGPGVYHETATYNPPNTGSFLLCAWLERPNEGEGSSAVAGPISTTFSVGPPRVSELLVDLPEPARPDVAFPIDYTTHTDQQLSMSSVIRPAGGLPCAADRALDSEQNQSESQLLPGPYEDNSVSIFGGPITTTTTTTEPAGAYVICTWIEGPGSDEVDAASATDIYVGTPPPPPPVPRPFHAGSPHLLLEAMRVSKHHGTLIKGDAISTLNGHLRISVSCGASVVRGDARVGGGEFHLALATPRRCRTGGTAHVTAVWAGSSGFLPQSVSARTRVAR